MRVYIKLTGSASEVPFNYQQALTRALHRWLGKNELHDEVSLYSFSWLLGGRATKSGLKFNDDGYFFVSAYQDTVVKRIVGGLQQDPSVAFGLIVRDALISTEPDFGSRQSFACASPIFIKRKAGDKIVHYTFDDEQSSSYLTETLRTKLTNAGLSADNVSVRFDDSYPTPRTKVVYYGNVGNRVSICPVIVEGTPEQIAFAWNVGVGNSTGIGFGALK